MQLKVGRIFNYNVLFVSLQQYKTVRETLSATSEGFTIAPAAELGGEHFTTKMRKKMVSIVVAELVKLHGTQ